MEQPVSFLFFARTERAGWLLLAGFSLLSPLMVSAEPNEEDDANEAKGDAGVVSASDWVKGIALSVLASIIGGASKLAIRKSWLLEEAQPLDGKNSKKNKSSCLSLSLRGSGMVGMTVLNPACCVWAMKYASPSILAPFSGLTLVWIVLFSEVLVGEQPQMWQIVAAALIIAGEVMVAVWGDHDNDVNVDVQTVMDSYKERPFLLYLAGLTLWMLLLVWFMTSPNTGPTCRRLAWGCSGGSITGLQNFLKDGLTVAHVDSWWFLVLCVALASATSFGGLLFLTACMKRYDATYSASMFVGSFVLSASLMSAVHYHTWQHLYRVSQKVLYPLGLLVLGSGVLLLLWCSRQQEKRRSSTQQTDGGDSFREGQDVPHDLEQDEEDDDDDEEPEQNEDAEQERNNYSSTKKHTMTLRRPTSTQANNRHGPSDLKEPLVSNNNINEFA